MPGITISIPKEPDPIPTEVQKVDTPSEFKTLIYTAFKANCLWVMADRSDVKYDSGKLKYRREYEWVPAEIYYTEDQLFDRFEGWAFGLSIYWLNNQKIPLFYLRSETYENLWETNWYRVFEHIRRAGIQAAMLFNVIGLNQPPGDGRHHKSDLPGLGLVFLSENDAIVAQAIIDEIDFNS